MDNPILVHSQEMAGWDGPDWESFIQTIGAMTGDPGRSWQLLMAINETFKELSPECQKKALIAVDCLILAVREDMEQIMATMQDVYQDAYAADQME